MGGDYLINHTWEAGSEANLLGLLETSGFHITWNHEQKVNEKLVPFEKFWLSGKEEAKTE